MKASNMRPMFVINTKYAFIFMSATITIDYSTKMQDELSCDRNKNGHGVGKELHHKFAIIDRITSV